MKNIQKYIPQNMTVEMQGNIACFSVSVSEIRDIVSDLYTNKGLALKLITATDERKDRGCFRVWYVFGVPEENMFIVPFIELKHKHEFPSISLLIHEAWSYERKIQTFFGLTAAGHPDTRPLVLHENWPEDMFPLRKDFEGTTRPKDAHTTPYQFKEIEGEGIYEIPVGPIHAGIIEPGHFRFSVAGEKIMFLEPRLGFVHKGSEKLFETLPIKDKVRLSEKISGDSSFSHSLAFCQAVEQLGDVAVSDNAKYVRVVFAELERLANHFGDIGAMMLDTGFNFGGAHGARLREMVMQIHERLTGSRFLRGVNAVGGVTKTVDKTGRTMLADELKRIAKDFSEVIVVAENSPSLLNRLKTTGAVSYDIAKDCGAVGVAGRAAGVSHDARVEYPYAGYSKLGHFEIALEQKGDVYARFHVRIKEVETSIALITEALQKITDEPMHLPKNETIKLKKNALAIGVVEGWRGDIVYFVTTDAQGEISRVSPRDPSFLNWSLLGYAGLGNIVPDFPLINKSFNLSYTGYDL